MNKCNCHSYNWDIGEVKPIGMITSEGEQVFIDECISRVITQLWANGIHTVNSCCGHGRLQPSIVLAQDADPLEASTVIAKIDTREFKLLQWQLIDTGNGDIHLPITPPF